MEQWPGSATIIAVRSHGTLEGKPQDEIRYYVTSLRTAAKALLKAIRQRWSNCYAEAWRLREQLALGEGSAAAGGRPSLPREQRHLNPGHVAQHGDQFRAAGWDLVDHLGHRRPL